MREETIKIYRFSELSESAKKKVLTDMYDINVIHDWWDSTYEDAANVGIEIKSFDIYHGECEGDLSKAAPDVCRAIMAAHGKKTATYRIAKEYRKLFLKEEQLERDEEIFEYEDEEKFLKEILEEYLKLLSEEYNFLTTEKAIIETIEMNEYEFTENGNLY